MENHFHALQDYYCVAPDLPGFGKSNQTKWTTLDDVTDKIKDLILASPHKKANVVGLSLGGSIILNLLGKYSQYIDRAIVDGAGIIPIRGVFFIKTGVAIASPFIHYDFVINLMTKALGLKSDKDILAFREAMKATDPYSFRTAFAQANDLSEPEGIEKVTVPTLFVAGVHEAKQTIQSGILLSQKMKNAECYVVPDMGHGWIGKAPDLHVHMTKAWLEGKTLPKALLKKR